MELVYAAQGRRSGIERRYAACANDILRFIADDLDAWCNDLDGLYSKVLNAYFPKLREILGKQHICIHEVKFKV